MFVKSLFYPNCNVKKFLSFYFGASECLSPPLANFVLTNELVTLAGFIFAPFFFDGINDRQSPPLAAHPSNATLPTHSMHSFSTHTTYGTARANALVTD